MKILLLGVGMQGKAALYDLAHSEAVESVVAADRDFKALSAFVDNQKFGPKVRCEPLDASDPPQIDRLVAARPTVVVDLLPVAFAGAVAQAAVKHGAHLVNTFYTTPEIAALSEEAERRNLTILTEFGLDPGVDLVLLGEAVRDLDRIESVRCYGAGIPEPEAANNPLKYKVTWTLEGVLKAYRRGGTVIREGARVAIPPDAMFAPENVHEVDVEGVGRLEAFPNGDAPKYAGILGLDASGLREMGRYTMRWPGHCEFWKKLVDLGLLDDEPVLVDGRPVDRRRFLAAVLEPEIQLGARERDLAFVLVTAVGTRDGRRTRVTHLVADRRDLATGFTAMSRTVGFTASIGAQLLGSGRITRRGVLNPAKDIPFPLLADELARRGIRVTSERAVLP